MSEIQVPPAPAAPAKKKMSGWAIAGLIVAGVLIYGALVPETQDATQTAIAATEFTEPIGLTSYDGVTVNEMVAIMDVLPETVEACSLIPTVGWDESRQMFLDTPPGLGSDAYEGAVFDALFAGC